MQPTCRHVPPRNGSFSTTTVFRPSSPARIAATYPPGPLPIIATSYFATRSLPSTVCSGGSLDPCLFLLLAPGFSHGTFTLALEESRGDQAEKDGAPVVRFTNAKQDAEK